MGGIGHLASKAALGGDVTLSDAFWAAADVVEIATTAVAIAAAIPSGGASVGAQAAATTAKTAAKAAAKTAMKAAAKSAAQNATKVGVKTVVKTGGKAVVRGSVRITGRSSAKLASNMAQKQILRSVGDRFVQYGIEEGVNSIYHTAGGKGRIPVLLGTRGGIKQAGKISGKVAIKNGGHAGAKAAAAKVGSITRYKNIPTTNGRWSGIPGDSLWIPDKKTIPQKFNPAKKTWGQILKENGMQKGIQYIKGEPVLSRAAKGTVTIKDFTIDRARNFAQADSRFAKWLRSGHKANQDIQKEIHGLGVDLEKISKGDIASLRRLGYTWHERRDMKTLDLISRVLHANLPHTGGIAALKEQLSATQTMGVLR